MTTATCIEETSRAGKIQNFSFYVHVTGNLVIQRVAEKWVFIRAHIKDLECYINETRFYGELEIKTLENLDTAIGKEYSGARLGGKSREDIPAFQQEIYIALLLHGTISIPYGIGKTNDLDLSQELREDLLKLWGDCGLTLPDLLVVKPEWDIVGVYYKISTDGEWFGLLKNSPDSLPEGGKIRSEISTFCIS
jgi:hypothetical protein